jgi:hypothetical protein
MEQRRTYRDLLIRRDEQLFDDAFDGCRQIVEEANRPQSAHGCAGLDAIARRDIEANDCHDRARIAARYLGDDDGGAGLD